MKQDVQLSLPIAEVSKAHPRWMQIFEDWSQKMPQLTQNQATLQSKNNDSWFIQFSTNQDYQLMNFFPLSSDLFSLQKPNILSQTDKEHSLWVKKAATVSKENQTREALVVFRDKQGRQSSQWIVFPKKTSPISALFWFCLLAFLGGVLLNFMPCVLPIVFLKLSNSVEQSQKSPANFIKSNIAYSAGVIFSFIILALLVVVLKEAGHAINWGFQMQNPTFLIGMNFLFLLISFNFMGWFAISIPHIPFFYKGENYLKHFLTGILSTTAASPCTVPFMGAAVAYAFAGKTLTVLIVFLFLGIGLSFPYLLLSCFPTGIKRLPTPGIWNERLKHCMVFPMLGTCAWLIHLINQHTNELFPLLFSMVSLALAFWLIQHTSQKTLWTNGLLKLIVLMSLVYPFLHFYSQEKITTTNIQWEDFSLSKLQNLQSQGESVFVQLSAQWCLTCKWNEQITFKNKKVIDFFNQSKIRTLKGDWTHKNKDISLLLDKYHRSGIPFYLYLPGKTHPKNNREILLPELITPNGLLKTLSQNTK